MKYPVYLYIAVMAIVTYLIRMLPLTLIKKEIKNPFIRSFLYYVPYVTLSVMTFPAIIYATASPVSGAAALAARWQSACGSHHHRPFPFSHQTVLQSPHQTRLLTYEALKT